MHIRTDRRERKRTQLRLAMRELKRWGEAPWEADCAPLYECYRYTHDEGEQAEYLLNRTMGKVI